MKRRNFLVGAGAASIGGSALLGSGAFSRIESDRAVTIAVAEDPDAYLGLDKCGDKPNSSYAHIDENGHIELLMNEDNPTRDDSPLGAGVNSNSTTWFHNVFQITNQGKERACVWITDDDDWPRIDGEERRVEFYLKDDDESSIVGEDNAIGLEVGGSVCVGLKTRTYDLSEGDELFEDMDNSIQINADVEGDCFPETVPDPEKYEIHLAYQDQGSPGGDFDYNDWLVDIDATFYQAGIQNNGGDAEYLSGIDLEFTPLAKSAGNEHEFQLIDDNGIIGDECAGTYDLTVIDDDGDVVRSESGTFNGGDETITIFESSEDVFDPADAFQPGMWNGDPGQSDCAEPIRTATLSLDFNDPCAFDFGEFDPLGDPDAPHGDGLFFNPKLTWTDSGGGSVERGDVELLTVPDHWPWPGEEQSIWDVYDEVGEDGGEPDFPEEEWRPPIVEFEGDEDNLFTLCDRKTEP